MILPKVSRRAAVILGKAAGVLILTAVSGVVTWLLEKERREILEESVRAAEEPVIEIEIPAPEEDDEA